MPIYVQNIGDSTIIASINMDRVDVSVSSETVNMNVNLSDKEVDFIAGLNDKTFLLYKDKKTTIRHNIGKKSTLYADYTEENGSNIGLNLNLQIGDQKIQSNARYKLQNEEVELDLSTRKNMDDWGVKGDLFLSSRGERLSGNVTVETPEWKVRGNPFKVIAKVGDNSNVKLSAATASKVLRGDMIVGENGFGVSASYDLRENQYFESIGIKWDSGKTALLLLFKGEKNEQRLIGLECAKEDNCQLVFKM